LTWHKDETNTKRSKMTPRQQTAAQASTLANTTATTGDSLHPIVVREAKEAVTHNSSQI